ncbi:gas vesicle protein [Streptomyces sp. NPDC051784]|uniref:gas vesicle protein GvpO n=1 Tax=Streptomyces sp. NPDC051784 TaxID=3155805 RepID=UPI00342D1417
MRGSPRSSTTRTNTGLILTSREEGPPKKRPRRLTAAEAMREASGQLAELVGTSPHAVTSVQANGEGWVADVEMTEIERIPDTSSVMATYRVELDGHGRLMGYEQTKRFSKGQIDRR